MRLHVFLWGFFTRLPNRPRSASRWSTICRCLTSPPFCRDRVPAKARGRPPLPLAEGPFDIPLVLAFADGRAFILAFFVAREGECEFDASVPSIQPQGDERQALLGRFSYQFLEFPGMEEKLPGAHRVVARGCVFGLVGRDGRVYEPRLAATDDDKGARDACMASPYGFDFVAV